MERSSPPLCVFLVATTLLAPAAHAQFEDDDPACPGAADAAPSAFVFADGFGLGTTCQWSFSPGWNGSCTGTCGDCTTDEEEVCDDGNQVTETECPYGTIFCTRCNDTCTAELQLAGPFCGDGNISVGEDCDDGNMVDESECPYGSSICQVCTSTCLDDDATGDYCGDGAVNSLYEDCDDGNTSACGTCSADCRSPRGAFATGMLAVPAGGGIFDGDTFTLDDGLGGVEIFEFDRQGNGVAPGHVLVFVPGAVTESMVRAACVNAINGASGLSIDASSPGGQIVTLVHQRQTSAGNVPIVESVFGEAFIVLGMSGGQAGDCGLFVGCASHADCLSGFCSNGSCDIP